ncbi:hypothetical protein Ccrd_011430 [Cynara cardunculus var. scolymus]|uniref:Uncharacterized protein n=1 Tax=Cynara cardunculus var. scolymus TaxID=59895 RepID=A0A124SHP4_CYNCS|nr:hypothetical protein Ccrd_011430 [Cynara cardunculus var. scolymus]
MMPEDLAMLPVVFMKFLYEMLSLSNKSVGMSEACMGGSPGISKSLMSPEVVVWMMGIYRREQRPEAPLSDGGEVVEGDGRDGAGDGVDVFSGGSRTGLRWCKSNEDDNRKGGMDRRKRNSDSFPYSNKNTDTKTFESDSTQVPIRLGLSTASRSSVFFVIGLRKERRYTGEVFEFYISLRTVGEKLGVVRVDDDGLRIEVNSEFKVIVDESLLRLCREIRRHRSCRTLWKMVVSEGKRTDDA